METNLFVPLGVENEAPCPARQNGDFERIFTYFRLFSTYGTPSAVFPQTCLRNSPIFVYFPPIFCLKWYPHPCYKLKHGTHLLFSRPHVYGFCLFSTYIPLIFRLTFSPYPAGPVLPGVRAYAHDASNPCKGSSDTSFDINLSAHN